MGTDELEKIGKYILEGLNTEEACIMAGYLPKELKEFMEANEGAKAFIEKKHIEYKHQHLQAINKNKSDKTSMWMLEKTRPEEFGNSRQRGTGDSVDAFKKLIKEIQKSDGHIIRDAEIVEVGPKKLGVGATGGVQNVLN